MLQKLRNYRAQAHMTEYVIVIFIVVGMMTAMGTYVKRALQGRIWDARNYAANTIKERTKGVYNGIVYLEYEPYYINTASDVGRDETTTSRLFSGDQYGKEINSVATVMTVSDTAPPKDAD